VAFFEDQRGTFELLKAKWRSPQLGALGSLIAHWRLATGEPALVSLPTGTGTTAVALASPFITPVPPKTCSRTRSVHRVGRGNSIALVQAALPYSLMSPSQLVVRSTVPVTGGLGGGSAVAGVGGRWLRDRCGRCCL